MMSYLILSGLALLGLFSLYWFVLRRNTFHQLNRWGLLFILFFSVLFPFLRLPVGVQDINLAATVIETSRDVIPPALTPGAVVWQSSRPEVSGKWLMTGIYLIGLLLLLVKMLLELFSIGRLIGSGRKVPHSTFTLVDTDTATPPLAFFHWIVINHSSHSPRQYEYILQHEQVHVRQWHTIDILFAELYVVVFWFHPLAWLLRREIKLNLEYLADQAVLGTGADRKTYQYSLLQLSVPDIRIRFTNHFNHSHLKTRINMMNCKRSSRLSFFNYLLFLPITLGLLLTLQPLNAQTASTVEDLNIDPGQSIYMKITGNMSEEEVNKIIKRVEETGVDFRGSKFEFNQKGQLSRASLNVKVANFNASVQSSGDGKSPMKEPVIFYLLREADDKLGVSVGLPSDLSPDHRRIFTKFNGLMIGHFSAD